MYTGQMDIISMILYIGLGIAGALCVFNEKNRYVVSCEGVVRKYYQVNYLMLFCCIFVFFATFRKIDSNLGGADAIVYLKDFDKMTFPDFSEYTHGPFVEFLFVIYMYIIRVLTSCRKVFVFISYGIISFSYMIVVRKYIKENISAIPFFLLAFLYLKAFCTMRSSLAIALFLIGLTWIDEHKVISLICVLSSFFVHRMAILFLPFFPYYLCFHQKIKALSGVYFAGLAILTMVVVNIAATAVQEIAVSMNILSNVDSWYIKAGMRASVLSRWPMFFAQMMLLICLTITDKENDKTELWHKARTAFAYDLMIIPAAIILGFWRANEFFYVFRLILWGYVIQAAVKWFKNADKSVFRIAVMMVFVAWFVFRIYSEWDDLKIMPYIFDFVIK